MASPRKQPRLDGDTPTTPQKSQESPAASKIVFTPIASFNWAEVSAQEYELQTSKAQSKTNEFDDSECALETTKELDKYRHDRDGDLLLLQDQEIDESYLDDDEDMLLTGVQEAQKDDSEDDENLLVGDEESDSNCLDDDKGKPEESRKVCARVALDEKEYPSLAAAQELEKKCADSGEPSVRSRLRKKPTPRRVDTGNKFDKNLDLSEALRFTRSQRIQKLKSDKRRVEQGLPSTSKSTESKQRKRRRQSPSVSPAASPTRDQQMQQSKVLRIEEDLSPRSSPQRSRKSMADKEDESLIPRPLENYAPPKMGWCMDLVTLKRRTKEINRAKDKPVYERYINEVAKSDRTLSDPKTPNKYLNYSRRSWDSQVRIWKRLLHVWAGEGYTTSENSSRTVSSIGDSSRPLSSVGEDNPEARESMDVDNQNENLHEDVATENVQPAVVNEDNMASLLGHFDLNTCQATLLNEESTLTPTENKMSGGPTDFSSLDSNK